MEIRKLFLNVTCLIEELIPEFMLYVFVGARTVCVTHEKERKKEEKND